MNLQSFIMIIDPLLILPYRMVDSGAAGYLLGTAVLACYAVVIGDLSATAVAYLNRGYLGRIRKTMEHHHRLSEQALRCGDKESYKAVNKQGLDAFGYSFSMGAALFSVSIWPLPFCLAWLSLRFAETPLTMPDAVPFFGGVELTYFTSFLLTYIGMRLCYSMITARTGWYRSWKKRVTATADRGEEQHV